MPKKTRTMIPIINGRMVLHDDHGYIAPAQLRGNANVVLPIVERSMPIQSKRRSLLWNDESIGRRRRKKKARMTPTAMMGRLIQPIHLQSTNSLNAAPMMGPQTPPPAIGRAYKPRYSGRSFKLVMSARMISLKTSSPPPPRPCKMRPTIKTGMLLATPKTMDPTKKSRKAA